MADDTIRDDQDDELDLDESISEDEGGLAELPEAASDLDFDEDDDFEEED